MSEVSQKEFNRNVKDTLKILVAAIRTLEERINSLSELEIISEFLEEKNSLSIDTETSCVIVNTLVDDLKKIPVQTSDQKFISLVNQHHALVERLAVSCRRSVTPDIKSFTQFLKEHLECLVLQPQQIEQFDLVELRKEYDHSLTQSIRERLREPLSSKNLHRKEEDILLKWANDYYTFKHDIEQQVDQHTSDNEPSVRFVQHIWNIIRKRLNELGILIIDEIGIPFDPVRHELLNLGSSKERPLVIDIPRPGYQYAVAVDPRGTVLQKARVMIES